MSAVSSVRELLAVLLRRSHAISGDELGPLVRELADELGLGEASIFLADLGQRVLVPLPPAEGGPLTVEGTLAGRSYRSLQPVATPVEGGVRLWVPLLDGADRLGVLGVTVAENSNDVLGDVTDVASLVALLVSAKADIDDLIARTARVEQLNLSGELRWSVLPPLSFSSPRVSVAAIMQPAYGIAGDAFDYVMSGGAFHAAVFDAVGHTLHSTLVANLALGAYRHGRRQGLALTELYPYVDVQLRQEIDRAEFVTALFTQLDLSSGHFTWVCAGHPSPLLVRGTTIHELHGPRSRPLGLNGQPPGLGAEDLQPGDRVVLYTDGVVEARLPDGEEFGFRRFADHLGRAQLAEEAPAETLRRLGETFIGAGVQARDDVTILVVSWPGPRPSTQEVLSTDPAVPQPG